MSRLESKPVASADDVIAAMCFAVDFFNRAYQARQLTKQEYDELTSYYTDQRERAHDHRPTDDVTLRPRDVCWSCRARCQLGEASAPVRGAPIEGDRVERLRHLVFLCFEIKKHEKAGRLTLATAHAFLADSNERIAALRNRLDKERAQLVEPVDKPADKPPPVVLELADEPPAQAPHRRHAGEDHGRHKKETKRRSVMEILLDPRSIQWLLASGGALLALGLLIWLIAQGVFKDRIFVAVLLGGGSVGLLAAGWALMLATRYQMAGRALTLLACLVLPLNLWFYDAQGLIVLAQGGHLWIPALVCCVLYAGSARLLKDVTFVPVLVLGVTATGLLLLADQDVSKFWEIAAPATLLVAIGILCVHVERLFPDTDTPFGRKRFGLGFFWSGHAVLAAGLLLLLGAQLAGGWLHSVFQAIYPDFERPQIVTQYWGKLLAFGLVLAGTYAYLYSDLVVRRVGVYLPIAVFTLLWAEVLLVTLVDEWPIPTVEVVILVLALTALGVNALIASTVPAAHGKSEEVPIKRREATLFRAGPPLGLILSTLPVLIGLVLQVRAVTAPFVPGNALTGSYVVVMVVTALSCRAGAHMYRHIRPWLAVVYFFGTAAATLMALAALLVVTWPQSQWQHQAPMLMLVPIAYLVAARLYRGHTAEHPLVWVAHTATGVMLFISALIVLARFLDPARPLTPDWSQLLSLFFAEAAVFYVLAAVLQRHSASIYLATATGCAAVGLLLRSWGVPAEYYTLTFAIVGLLLLVGYRLAMIDRYGEALAVAAFGCGNALLSLSFVAAALLTLNHLAAQNVERPLLLPLLLTLVCINLVTIILVRHQDWRRWYVVTMIVNAALSVLVLVTELPLGQKLEIVSLAIGATLLVASHLGWYREQERQDDMVSLGLIFGSLLVAIPVTLVVLGKRLGLAGSPAGTSTPFYTWNEIGMLGIGLLLLATGYLCQLRATTMVGTIMMALFLLSLLCYIRLPDKLQRLAVYIMIGGGVFFGVGLLLAVYRDRLLTLPDRIKRREGIFKVLSWR